MRLNRHRLADIAGVTTLVIGTGLTVAPRRSAALLGMGTTPNWSRTVGLTDLALAVGMLRGRHWAWMVARSSLNLALANHYRRESRRNVGNTKARGGAVAMLALTVFDGSLALALRAESRRPESSTAAKRQL